MTTLTPLWTAVRYVLVGAVTAVLSIFALAALGVVLALCLIGVGLPALPEVLRLVRPLIAYDRERAGRYLGTPIAESYEVLDGPALTQAATAIADPANRRDLGWLVVHGFGGMLLAGLVVGFPFSAVNNLLIPAYWWLVPGGVETSFGLVVDSWATAATTPVAAAVFAWLTVQTPRFARWHALLARRLLSPPEGVRLTDRVAELTASRAGALEAHGAELRRIERDLHDGAQARIAAVVMQLGIADQMRERDPDAAFALVRKAQDTATDALAELRDVVRSIYPPVLSDRGLDGAVSALAARCPVPTALEVAPIGRRPAAIEAAAYFIIAEALTNITKHSAARAASVRLDASPDRLFITVSDNGRGGADGELGTGIVGIQRRADAFDGRADLSSPPGGPTVLRVELPCGL
ncbi:sensor domain-containing protein [Actinosynnema sp. NPDC047251]|uniref:histidine kinase n=1 Tax=Saccharothrix espanaensis (strain ATCC 51144 / DSM 44229 / JCM 9112 / NBRC 15066 / NRRL 15764) TaxID=1179773 RepID=K0KAZ7_SACES|nr:sensor histidine kinase [Saccharothrix espanaensis]CCH33989.1 Two-component system, sensor histidine kinase [Saccharothrix espanaensis DSM 44229]